MLYFPRFCCGKDLPTQSYLFSGSSPVSLKSPPIKDNCGNKYAQNLLENVVRCAKLDGFHYAPKL